jgi:hypothetical protein
MLQSKVVSALLSGALIGLAEALIGAIRKK